MTRGDATARKFCEFLRHLFIKFERITFAFHFGCTESLSWTSDITYSGDLKQKNKQTPLDLTKYKDYTIMSFPMIQMGLAKELNDCLKALVRGESTWASERLTPLHLLTKHSYICILMITMKCVLSYSQTLDRRMVVAMMRIVPNVDRLSFFTYLMSAYWMVYAENLFDLFQKHFNHECRGDSLDSCDPDEDLFFFGDKDSKLAARKKNVIFP
jgi:hypothetical protein